MSARKNLYRLLLAIAAGFLSFKTFGGAEASIPADPAAPFFTVRGPNDSIAEQLGWVTSTENYCGGYYLEDAFAYPVNVDNDNLIEVTGNQGLISMHSKSTLEGGVTITRYGQQITANKAYIFRDPQTFKLTGAEMIGNVHLREPNTLILGRKGRYNFITKSKSLINILYRTQLSGRQLVGPNVSPTEMQNQRKISRGLTAWGQAYEFSQTQAKIYELNQASYSTCPPANPAWRLKASHIVLNKNTGTGYATNARILLKGLPVFYTPYISFPLDSRRKSGFLWPTLGASNKWGPYLRAPFYWNIAPNYDMTITPGLLSKRGVQLSDNFRYLTHTNYGHAYFSVLPEDRAFAQFKIAQEGTFANSTNPTTQAELNRLLNANDTRKAIIWRDDSRFSDNWSSHVDFNYVSDDYYLRDFSNDFNSQTQNQLLQQGELYFKSQNWNFTGRMQAYQTLHPINEAPVKNQYRRFPQLILSGDYPDQPLGLDYFINNEVTHFDIRNTPGTVANLPIGNRLHTQPGISLPLSSPYLYVNPRAQLAMTEYQLYQTAATKTPTNKHRTLPILDIDSGMAFNRDIVFFDHGYQQTLEPQAYYVYIPYRNQASIPTFDTTVNTLSYEQLFNYNRYSGLDRIGDTNQIAVGLTTRFIDQDSGLQKLRLRGGDIIYFANRRVTLCNDNSCTDNPSNSDKQRRLSPIFAGLDYTINPYWTATGNTIWNPVTKQFGNQTINLQYHPDDFRVINLGFNYLFNGDILSGSVVNTAANNMKITDISFSWPIVHEVSVVGRWSQDWAYDRLQNLLYGLQYDTCCWAVRMVGGRAFLGLDPNSNFRPKYNNQFYLQFSLKGLSTVGSDPTNLLKTISGYKSQFGQEI